MGWAAADHMRTGLVLEALSQALGRRQPDAGLLHHSDRGSQYASRDYQAELGRRGIVFSMSRRGNCYDNAVAESFFGTLKTELIHRHPWPTRASAKRAIAEYIEAYYNPHRRHSALVYPAYAWLSRARARRPSSMIGSCQRALDQRSATGAKPITAATNHPGIM